MSDFPTGFRPGRSPHQALDALAYGIWKKWVNWIFDADLQSFFDTLRHDWLVQFLEYRIADPACDPIDPEMAQSGRAGRRQTGWSVRSVRCRAGSISPLLANIYLYYAFDLWVQQWRTKQAHGDVLVVRFADDFVVGFQHGKEAERFQEELRERLAKFGLKLYPEKTRLVEFGRFALQNQKTRGKGKPVSGGLKGSQSRRFRLSRFVRSLAIGDTKAPIA